MTGPFKVVRDFENAVAEYTGAPYCAAVNSCTMALRLALEWERRGLTGETEPVVTIPARTYVSVPVQIKRAGFGVAFDDRKWSGLYRLNPFSIFDSARFFSGEMFSMLMRFGSEAGVEIEGRTVTLDMPTFVCVSFHASKTLGIEQGGAILHNSPEARDWFKRMRFDGRSEGIPVKDDIFTELGFHCYMNPSTAAQGLLKLHSLPKQNDPLPNDDYPDLSTFEIFK